MRQQRNLLKVIRKDSLIHTHSLNTTFPSLLPSVLERVQRHNRVFFLVHWKEESAWETSNHDMIKESATVIMGIAVSHICDCQCDCSWITFKLICRYSQNNFVREKSTVRNVGTICASINLSEAVKKTYWIWNMTLGYWISE